MGVCVYVLLGEGFGDVRLFVDVGSLRAFCSRYAYRGDMRFGFESLESSTCVLSWEFFGSCGAEGCSRWSAVLA
jgi:hypothetical protein